MSDTLPDRLCADPKSPFYNEKLVETGVGIRFNGQEKTNVHEYCVSEGWVRVSAGTAKDRHGNPLTITVTGLPTVGTVTLADGTVLMPMPRLFVMGRRRSA